jgi:hypothetical protein
VDRAEERCAPTLGGMVGLLLYTFILLPLCKLNLFNSSLKVRGEEKEGEGDERE